MSMIRKMEWPHWVLVALVLFISVATVMAVRESRDFQAECIASGGNVESHQEGMTTTYVQSGNVMVPIMTPNMVSTCEGGTR